MDAVVVGSGPNGLAAAVSLARAGLSVQVLEAQPTVGGGARTVDLGLADGVRHDLCSAVHPMAVASPFLRAFDLRARGVRLLAPEISFAQPLDGGRAGVAYRDLDRTVAGLGADGPAWDALMRPLVEHWEDVVRWALGDHRSVPGGPTTGLRFGLRVLEQGTRAWDRRFAEDRAPALLTGVAAHAITPLPSLAAAGTALLLGSLGHAVGWPVPVGGSQAIIDALVADLRAHGGSVQTGVEVTDRRQLPAARAYLFDTPPPIVAQVFRAVLPPRVARAMRAHRFGDAAAKVDFVLSGPVPWQHPEVARAGTVHVGGTREQMAAAERAVAAGRHAEHPMTLVSDPAAVDPSRSSRGLRPLWTYAHVPAGSTRDMTETVTAQIERFAPGFRDVVVAAECTPAARLSEHNANYVGGDISAGAVTLYRMVARPSLRWNPYATPLPGVYLCSAATPPGPGVHGMSGWWAARRVLRDRFGIAEPPPLAPA